MCDKVRRKVRHATAAAAHCQAMRRGYSAHMPTLKNPRHESFARRVAEGDTSATGAYREGYASTGHGAEVNASKLLRKTEVQARIAELQAAAAKKTIVSVASLLDELEAA